MKIKLLSIIVIICVGSISCSDNMTEIEKPNTDLKLAINKDEIVPFENLKVSIDLDVDLLHSSYDSIIWFCNGVSYGIFSYPIDKDERDLDITDYRLGKNKVYTFGYKDGIIKSEAAIEYEVIKPINTFLSLEWGNSEKKNVYYHYRSGRIIQKNNGDIKGEGLELKILHLKENVESEYACLAIESCGYNPIMFRNESFMYSWRTLSKTDNTESALPDIENYNFSVLWTEYDSDLFKEAYLMTYTFLHNYITLVYGESTLKYNGDDLKETTLWEDYNKRFKNPLTIETYPGYKDKYPVEIWDTPSSYICLFAVQDGFYYVIAEPRY